MSGMLPRGLLGGLTNELGLAEADLVAHIEHSWNLRIVKRPYRAILDVSPWRRGGAETYVAHSRIIDGAGVPIDVFAKAFVSMGLRPELQQQRWEDRRRIFQGAGIRVPALIAQYPGMSVEEYIPDSVCAGDLTSVQAYELGAIAKRLQGLRLQPLALLSDVRAKAGEFAYVDFGTDVAAESDPEWPLSVAMRLNEPCRQAFFAGLDANDLPH